MEQKKQTPILSHLEGQARNAHMGTSFSPERRGTDMINDYSEELTGDMEELKAGGASDERIADYKERYEKFFRSYLGAKSRTFSSMIAGGSNFPVRRHEKANRSEHKHYEVFREWRSKAKKAIMRKPKGEATFLSELDRYRADLAGMQKNHEIMKACNIIIRKAKRKDCTAELVAAGLSEAAAKKIQAPDFVGRIGYPSFHLTNNNANIKRVEERIKVLEQKEAIRSEVPITDYIFDGGTVSLNYEEDRIQIRHDARPTREELIALKAKGLSSFNWSPSNKAWQRKITPNAIWQTNKITGLNIK